MDRNSIIDKTTFEVCMHAENHPNVFVCDKAVAPAVALLNKKGYKTFSSCSGHYRIEFYEYLDEDIINLEKYKNNKRIIIKKIKDNSFDYWKEVDKTLLYILFTEKYAFDNLPNGFALNINNGLDFPRTCIECEISYYDEFNEHRIMNDVLNEIDKKCKLLEKWVNNLPNQK
ncbi:MAG: hypothetical protein IJ094_00190 [Bacilli bacterium]|nr:hypothetical protein [Bacilli bacterium]